MLLLKIEIYLYNINRICNPIVSKVYKSSGPSSPEYEEGGEDSEEETSHDDLWSIIIFSTFYQCLFYILIKYFMIFIKSIQI